MSRATLNLPPKVKGPGAGTLLRLWGNPLRHLEKMRAVPEPMVRYRAAGEQIYLAKDPALIHEVLVTKNRHFNKGRSLERARLVFGNGLVMSEGIFYRRQRRLMQPAFHSRRIHSFGEVMTRQARLLMADWQDGESRELSADMMGLTLRIVCETLLGADVDAETVKVRQAMRTLMRLFPLVMLPFGKVLTQLPVPVMKKLRKARAELDSILYPLIQARREEGSDHGDLLSMLLAAQDPESAKADGMTDQEVHDEVMIIFLAGHETTSVAFCWTWYLLAQHPEMEARLHAEVDRVLQDDRPATAADLPQLEYTRKVVMESMRVYPPVWAIARRAVDHCQIGPYDVLPRTLVISSQWILHRDPSYFEDPLEFRPERWTPDLESKLPKFVYFPFGEGIRRCMGENFAWMELILVVATMARRWRFCVDPKARIVPNPLFTLALKDGLPVTLARR